MRMDSIKGSNKYKYATTPLDPSYARTTCLGVALSGCGVPRRSLARRRAAGDALWCVVVFPSFAGVAVLFSFAQAVRGNYITHSPVPCVNACMTVLARPVSRALAAGPRRPTR